MVQTSDGAIAADRVVSTLAPRLTCRLVPELPADYRARHEWGQAYGAHCLVLSLDRPLTDTYWMNVNDPGFPFMALVEHTNYLEADAYAGRHLVYLGNYRPMDDPLMTMPSDEVVSQFAPAPVAHQSLVQLRLDHRCLGFRRALRPAHRDDGLPRPHPALRDADSGALGGEHVPGLPARPRAELLGRRSKQIGRTPQSGEVTSVTVVT